MSVASYQITRTQDETGRGEDLVLFVSKLPIYGTNVVQVVLSVDYIYCILLPLIRDPVVLCCFALANISYQSSLSAVAGEQRRLVPITYSSHELFTKHAPSSSLVPKPSDALGFSHVGVKAAKLFSTYEYKHKVRSSDNSQLGTVDTCFPPVSGRDCLPSPTFTPG